MKPVGFTSVELAIVLSISAILVPAIYVFGHNLEHQRAVGLWQLEVADEVRSLGEALRGDRRALKFSARGGLRLDGPGPCSPIEYTLSPEKTIVRRAPAACGGETTLSTHVTRLTHEPGGITATFALDPVKTEIFIAVED